MENSVIEVKNVCKNFTIVHERKKSIRDSFLQAINKKENEKKRTKEKLQVLNNISFNVDRGDFIGIIGKNGSGKSTLLKMITGILNPDSGEIIVKDKIAPLLQLGVGFEENLTAIENIYLAGILLGIEKKKIKDKIERIISFAELEKFQNTKIKNFSSGMLMRLAFSTAIEAEAPILLIDEALSVGDSQFQDKCFSLFEMFKEKSKTVLFVSHDLNAIRQFCNRVIYIGDGEIIKEGNPDEVIIKYKKDLKQLEINPETKKEIVGSRWGDMRIVTEKVRFLDENYQERPFFYTNDNLMIEINLSSVNKIEDPVAGIIIYDNKGNFCFSTNTDLRNITIPSVDGKKRIFFKINNNYLGAGKYFLTVAIHKRDHTPYDWQVKEFSFIMKSKDKDLGICRLNSEWVV